MDIWQNSSRDKSVLQWSFPSASLYWHVWSGTMLNLANFYPEMKRDILLLKSKNNVFAICSSSIYWGSFLIWRKLKFLLHSILSTLWWFHFKGKVYNIFVVELLLSMKWIQFSPGVYFPLFIAACLSQKFFVHVNHELWDVMSKIASVYIIVLKWGSPSLRLLINICCLCHWCLFWDNNHFKKIPDWWENERCYSGWLHTLCSRYWNY